MSDPERPSRPESSTGSNTGPDDPRRVDPRAETVPEEGGTDAPRREADRERQRSTRYEILETLGEGGMAVVYTATDTDLKRTVAVKCLKDDLAGRSDLRERFFDEAEIMADLDHPGTIPVFDAGKLPDGKCFYSMKRVQGRTLKDLLDERSAEEIRSRHSMMHFVDIFERVCQTMAAVHAHDIIHRDLKPENVMVDEFGGVYVMDWGLAKRMPRGKEAFDSLRTRAGAVMGTPAYMSPELARGAAHESDTQTDVFSLGIMLYEILTGRNPFQGRTQREAMKGVLYHDPDTPKKANPRASRALSAVCMKSLNKDPLRRYPTARELAEDMRSYREFRPVSAIPPRLTDRLYNWARRRPALASSLATLAVVAAITAAGAAFQASVENLMVQQMYEVLDERLAEIKLIDAEMERASEALGRAAEDSAEQFRLRRELETLESRRDVEDGIVRGLAWAIMGYTIFSPEARAREITRNAYLSSISDALEVGDYIHARVQINYALADVSDQNFMDFKETQIAWLNERLAEVERAIEDEERRE